MQRILLKSKLHRATVTDSQLHYEGSVTIDSQLMATADIFEHEQVHVLNVNNGERFITYAISGEAGSGIICINGAAARLVAPGDLVIICTYAEMTDAEARNFKPTVIPVDEKNRPRKS